MQTAHGGDTVLMKCKKVVPRFGARNPFALEDVTAIEKCHEFNMGDKKARLIVGTLTYADADDEITLLAFFPLLFPLLNESGDSTRSEIRLGPGSANNSHRLKLEK